MPVDEQQFLDVMSAFPTGVVIVTTIAADGTPRGLTTNAFTSVSRDPPLLLVCLDRTSRTLPAVQESGRFVVHVMPEGRDAIARKFATKDDDKFDSVEWRPAGNGMPHLHVDSLAYAECTVEQAVEAGDHMIVVGLVEAGGIEPEAIPLVYFRRTYAGWRG